MEIVLSQDRPDLEKEAGEAFRERWPEFIFHDAVPKRYMPRVGEYFGDYDILLLDDGKVAAGGWGVPLRWDGTVADLPAGYDDALVRSVEGHEQGVAPNAFSFMAAAVAKAYDRQGLATDVLTALADKARRRGIEHVIAPIRPTWKARYPQVSMAEYATWTREDGLSIDPWIRTHQRMGATVLAPASPSMLIEGTVAEWEEWTGMLFPVTGDYVVPDALALLHVDREADRATYREENLWVQHR
ncbi:MAG TPA: GNAT family N-acetyltransferase [Marmoricola sp.]|nr:GNAT family N-acetyltransferase [Marmoricola sp.]